MAAAAPYPLIHRTTSLCGTCRRAVAAEVRESADGGAWMEKACPEHGDQRVRLSDDAGWYARTRRIRPPSAPPPGRQPHESGCPFDCGPCESHDQRVRLPVVTITSACDLRCPICYVHNKNEDPFHMGRGEFARVLEHLTAAGGGALDLINFTGGEPTNHPHFSEFLEMCQAAGVHRVAICTNGLRLAEDEALARRLAALDARIALSFDSFEPGPDVALQGAHLVELKLRCLDILERHDLDTTLIPVMTRGYNDHEIGRIIAHGLARRNVRHVEVHTMTYTGQGGRHFDRSGRISMHEVLLRIEETTNGLLTPTDFVPSPCAHSLCYQIAYLLLDPQGGAPIPFARFMAPETLYDVLREHLYLEPSARLERAILDAIDRLWSSELPDGERTLRILKDLLRRMFPRRALPRAAALRIGEQAVKAVYVHSHMDEETFDVERAALCCDANCTADGRTIPVCNYNVLYRDKQPRFMATPADWGDRSGGDFDPAGRLRD